jgi:hypothetical protein
VNGKWILLPERRPALTIVVIGLAFLVAYLSSLVLLPKSDGRIVVGDAVHYYVYLRSAVFDRDLRFKNEYVRLYGLRGGEPGTEWVYEPTATGHTRNLMSIGPAIVWAPAFLAVTAGAALAGATGASIPLDGYGRVFQATAGVTGIVAAMLGAWLTWRLTEAVVSRRSAIWATLTVWLGSSALYYSAISPTYSHAVSMLTTSLFLLAWWKTRDRQTIGRYLMVGAFGGLCALVRWQDVVFLLAPAIEMWWRTWKHREVGVRSAMGQVIGCALGAIVVFSPQLVVWTTLYGSPLLVPQGADFMRWGAPRLLEVLFSDNHGLISWTPVVAVGLVGLVLLWRAEPLLAGVSLAIVALSWYANAAAADWWAGEAFGARRFVSCFPLFVLGLAAVFERWQHRLGIVVAISLAFISTNVLLLVQYQAFMRGARDVVPYPRGIWDLYVARFLVPFDLLRRAIVAVIG